MTIFYHQYRDRWVIVCTSDVYPTRNSPIWKDVNTQVLLVPGTYKEDCDIDDE